MEPINKREKMYLIVAIISIGLLLYVMVNINGGIEHCQTYYKNYIESKGCGYIEPYNISDIIIKEDILQYGNQNNGSYS